MDNDELNATIAVYKEQLVQINSAISASNTQEELDGLISLKKDIQQLLSLTEDSVTDTQNGTKTLEDEYAQFMAEMEKEGAYGTSSTDSAPTNIMTEEELKSLEGTKCKAPHEHNWGEIIYHNAMICSVIPNSKNIEVKVMFINPTHKEMLPCPYFLETDCKFTEDKCRFSHGETVLYSAIKEYVEPKFDLVAVGTKVLAKKDDNLWYRGTVRRLVNQRCLIKFDSVGKDVELELHDILPLDDQTREELSEEDEAEDEPDLTNDDIINMSLMITPASTALGEWEKHTKGIGSKLMEKMGYVTGTGLGRAANGRLEPVTAVILPPGKSLDHCMHLREKAGGDENLFSVDRKLKRQQKKQEIRSQKAYEREKNKVDVFDFLNDTLSLRKEDSTSKQKSKHRQEIKGESSRNLNVASLKLDEEIKRIERDLFTIEDSLKRHNNVASQVNKNLRIKQVNRQRELQLLRERAVNIKTEQSVRHDKKKLTIF